MANENLGLDEHMLTLERVTRPDWQKLLRELETEEPTKREMKYMIYHTRLLFALVNSIDRLDHFSTRSSVTKYASPE